MKQKNKKDKKENQWNNKNKSMDECNEAKRWLKLTNTVSSRGRARVNEHKSHLSGMDTSTNSMNTEV